MVLKMGIILGVLILTGALAWAILSALCVAIIVIHIQSGKGAPPNYYEHFPNSKSPRVSKRVFKRVLSKYRPDKSNANLLYKHNYLVIFEKSDDSGFEEYVCFTCAELVLGGRPYMVKFEQKGTSKYVLLDLRSDKWVAIKCI